jgi:hypothetical protein
MGIPSASTNNVILQAYFVGMGSGSVAAWSSGSWAGSYDVNISRTSAGVLQIGSSSVNTSGSLILTWVRTVATTVSSLPSAATAGAGARSFVTDANATTFLSTVAGGGSNKVPVVSDGTNWLIG